MSDSFETAYNSLRGRISWRLIPMLILPDSREDQRYMDERRCKDELIRIYKQEIVPKMESRRLGISG